MVIFFQIFYLGSISQYGNASWICILIIHDSAGRERNNFQQQSKLSELKFISTTWPHRLSLINEFAQQQISACPKSFSETSNTQYNYSWPFLVSKFCCMHRIPNVFKIPTFPMQNIFSQFLDKFLNLR